MKNYAKEDKQKGKSLQSHHNENIFDEEYHKRRIESQYFRRRRIKYIVYVFEIFKKFNVFNFQIQM